MRVGGRHHAHARGCVSVPSGLQRGVALHGVGLRVNVRIRRLHLAGRGAALVQGPKLQGKARDDHVVVAGDPELDGPGSMRRACAREHASLDDPRVTCGRGQRR